jgi:predicted HD phosphohydrolase
MDELTITSICQLLESKGSARMPSSVVSLLDHALQTASLAERAGASNPLVCACLLHDIGHVLVDPPVASSPDAARPRGHGARASARLDKLFGAAVVDPIRLHVDAKRYLCYAHPGYAHGLSADARRSLEVQGGAFSPDQARTFMQEPHAVAAVNLRLWDDQAHVIGAATPTLSHYAVLLRTCVLPKGTLQAPR